MAPAVDRTGPWGWVGGSAARAWILSRRPRESRIRASTPMDRSPRPSNNCRVHRSPRQLRGCQEDRKVRKANEKEEEKEGKPPPAWPAPSSLLPLALPVLRAADGGCFAIKCLSKVTYAAWSAALMFRPKSLKSSDLRSLLENSRPEPRKSLAVFNGTQFLLRALATISLICLPRMPVAMILPSGPMRNVAGIV